VTFAVSWVSLAGGSPAASHFLLSRQKKVTQEKATPTSPNSRKPSLPDGRRRTRTALLFLIGFLWAGLKHLRRWSARRARFSAEL